MLLLVMSLGGCAHGGPDSSRVPAPEACIPSLMFPALDVLDLEAAEAFYVDMLGMEVTLRLGDEASERQEVTLCHRRRWPPNRARFCTGPERISG